MIKMYGVKIKSKYMKEYTDSISTLIDTDMVQNLSNYHQHLKTNRLTHCIAVSYYSYVVAKKLGLDMKTSARAGLLHDLFFYNTKETGMYKEDHLVNHSKIAVDNARKITKLNMIEEDAIINHMWPMTTALPKYKESWIVNMVDKYCSIKEVLTLRRYKNAASDWNNDIIRF